MRHGHRAPRFSEGACRESDTVIRWGGDEFLIVGRCANVSAAEDLAERVRGAVDGKIELAAGAVAEISCSVGFACYPFFRTQPGAISWEHVIAIADRALYIAKHSGPNAWVGILGTKASATADTEDLVTLIDEQPERLESEGRIALRSSIGDRTVVWVRRIAPRT